MAQKTHRHRVPTARPPAQALGVIYLWGRGRIGSDLRTYLHDEHANVVEHDDVARELAIAHGAPLDLVGDAWAWRVEGANARIIDLITRDDAGVHGWTQFARETCAPSVALRNALNALAPDERERAADTLARRFGKGGPGPGGDGGRWIAADNRSVYYDAQSGHWKLGDYVAG